MVQVLTIGESGLTSVWRVDDELLTMDKVTTDNLDNVTPLNYWLFAMIGSGSYCYFATKEQAKAALIAELQSRIQELNDSLAELGQE